MNKKTYYGYKLSSESLIESLSMYTNSKLFNDFHKSKKEVKKFIAYDKKLGNISKNSKPKIFKITIEILDEKQK